jgi:hypothetical protein
VISTFFIRTQIKAVTDKLVEEEMKRIPHRHPALTHRLAIPSSLVIAKSN